jgi:CheY-like chemotaxis protein
MCGKILLADPDESVRRMIARVLECAGYEVVPAADGTEAVATFHTQLPDLVLFDLELLEPDGWEFFDKIRDRDAAVPIVVLSAWPNQYQPDARRGIDAHIEKPLDLPLFLASVREVLHSRVVSPRRPSGTRIT